MSQVITPETFSALRAAPGWVICERVKPQEETKTAGGLVIPNSDKLNPALMTWGRVVSCGAFYSQQAGESEVKDWWGLRWPLPKGTLILYHPHNPWEIRGSGKDLIAIKSTDVIGVASEED